MLFICLFKHILYTRILDNRIQKIIWKDNWEKRRGKWLRLLFFVTFFDLNCLQDRYLDGKKLNKILLPENPVIMAGY